MSSQPTETESSLKSASAECAYRRSKFIRTSSLEKLRFICSQNYYYILPALLAWLRTSHTVAKKTLETVIHNIKNNMFAFVIHDSVNAACGLIQKRFLTIVVYLTVAAVFSQLLICVYYLSSVMIPAGLLFLVTCLYLISHINLSCLNYFLAKEEKDKKPTPEKVKMPRLSRRDILGKRTISNFDFF